MSWGINAMFSKLRKQEGLNSKRGIQPGFMIPRKVLADSNKKRKTVVCQQNKNYLCYDQNKAHTSLGSFFSAPQDVIICPEKGNQVK